jgi:hypothetical protein
MFAAMDKDGDGALAMQNGEMMTNCCPGEAKDQAAMEGPRSTPGSLS